MPGGSCGIWGRSLCINASTLEGAMYDYIAKAHERGWIVIVADPFGDDASPHRHMLELSKQLLSEGQGPIMIVAHSYGAAMTLGMLKGNSQLQVNSNPSPHQPMAHCYASPYTYLHY